MTPPNLLVVDDTPANLQLLSAMLKERGYKVRPVPSGELALEAARSQPPDLIFLDITMPGMNGFAVCRRLKADAGLADIPVLFISALNEVTDKVEAFRLGGMDFITKPFQVDEVVARVRTHLELRRHQLELQASYRRLRETERMRDSLVHMVVHDMRSPLTALRMLLDMMRTAKGAEFEELWRSAFDGVKDLAGMADDMLAVSRLEAGMLLPERQRTEIGALVEELRQSLGPICGSVRLEVVPAPETVLWCDAVLVRRVLQNLIINALKFSPNDAVVTVSFRQEADGVWVEVTDQGVGIPPENQQRIFEKFVQLDGPKRKSGTGLGLTFCKLAVEAHGGTIGVHSRLGQGSTFWFRLPV